MKGHGKFESRLNPAFQIRSQKISQFAWSGQKGSKFQIFFLSFVWKVNCFNQKLPQEFHFVTLKGHGEFGSKLNPALQIRPNNNWSISFHQAKKVQVWYFIPFYSLKSKLLEPKYLHRSFILWHWKAMQSLDQNESCFPNKSKKKLVNLFPACEKGPNFKFYSFLLTEE